LDHLAPDAVFTWLMSSTAFCWHIYAVGGNEESARLSGVPVDRLKVVAYVVGGLMAAVGGFLLTARLGTGTGTGTGSTRSPATGCGSASSSRHSMPSARIPRSRWSATSS
jgi:ABC-type glucose/galactose transport system permease subunit